MTTRITFGSTTDYPPITVEEAEPPAGWFDDMPASWHVGEPTAASRRGDAYRAFLVYGVRFVDGVGYTDDARAIALFTWRAANPRPAEQLWTGSPLTYTQHVAAHQAAIAAWLATRP